MARSTIVWWVFAVAAALLASLAYVAARHTHSGSDFVITSRRLGGWVAGLAYTANVLNAWILLIVCGAAFLIGLPAVWMALGLLLGSVINVSFAARRLRALGALHGMLTLGEVLALDVGDRLLAPTVRSVLAIGLFTLLLQASCVLQFASTYAAGEFGMSGSNVATLGLLVVTTCALIGGLRAMAAVDVAQTLVMLGVGAALAVGGVASQGGWDEFWAAFHFVAAEGGDWMGGADGVIAVAFCCGGMGLGFAVLGQPHAFARVLALRDERALVGLRWVAILCSAGLLASMLMCGWVARVLYAGLQQPEHALFTLAIRPLPPFIGAVIVAAILCAMFSTAGSAILAAASACAVELKPARASLSAAWTRVLFVLVAALALLAAVFLRLDVKEQMLLAFSAAGAAFGPVLLVRLAGKRIRPATQLGAIWAGFGLTVVFHLLPDAPGDFLERVLPFVASLGIALTGGERRRNPDRADRSQQTVHDRVPI